MAEWNVRYTSVSDGKRDQLAGNGLIVEAKDEEEAKRKARKMLKTTHRHLADSPRVTYARPYTR